jgi:hypothetical protein
MYALEGFRRIKRKGGNVMRSNFSLLQENNTFNSFSAACIEAEKSLIISPVNCAVLVRRAVELAVKWLYVNDYGLSLPYNYTLTSLVRDTSFIDIVGLDNSLAIKYIIQLGNKAVHSDSVVTKEEAVLSLKYLHKFVLWIAYCYSNTKCDVSFAEGLLQDNYRKQVMKEKAMSGGFTGGAAPYGYKVVNGELEVDETKAITVRLIFKLRKDNPLFSLSDIAREVNSKGCRTTKNSLFCKTQIKRILDTKEFYEGTYKYGAIVSKGKHEPILVKGGGI